jgi:TPR repeat protein
MLRNVVLFCVIVTLLSPAWGQNQDIAALRLRAESGDPAAQAQLGKYYEQGKGVGKDYAQALQWFKKSADQGNAAGLDGLGKLYMWGHGVPRDFVQARDLFTKAADQGNADAQHDLVVTAARSCLFDNASPYLKATANSAQTLYGKMTVNGKAAPGTAAAFLELLKLDHNGPCGTWIGTE